MSNCKRSCKYLTKVLRFLIQRVERDDVRTVEALLIHMTGSRVAGNMLHHLLRWWPNATNPDGWVYKSHADWWAELAIKQSELPKANGALERVGVISQTKKANGAPTKHYKLDEDKFWQMVGQTLKIDANAFSEMLQNAFADSDKMDFANGSKSITTTPATIQDNNAVLLDSAILQTKKVRGVSDYTARQWVAQYGAERVIAVARMIAGRGWKNPAGAMLRALQEQWECVPVEMESPYAFSEGKDEAKYGDDPSPVVPSPTDEKEPSVPGQRDISENDTEPDGDPDPTPAVEIPVVDPTSPESLAWNSAYSQLEIQLDRASFDTWLRGAWLYQVDGNKFTVAVANKYAADMLNTRMMRDVKRIVEEVYGQPVELVFEVQKCNRPEKPLPLFKLLADKPEKVA